LTFLCDLFLFLGNTSIDIKVRLTKNVNITKDVSLSLNFFLSNKEVMVLLIFRMFCSFFQTNLIVDPQEIFKVFDQKEPYSSWPSSHFTIFTLFRKQRLSAKLKTSIIK